MPSDIVARRIEKRIAQATFVPLASAIITLRQVKDNFGVRLTPQQYRDAVLTEFLLPGTENDSDIQQVLDGYGTGTWYFLNDTGAGKRVSLIVNTHKKAERLKAAAARRIGTPDNVPSVVVEEMGDIAGFLYEYVPEYTKKTFALPHVRNKILGAELEPLPDAASDRPDKTNYPEHPEVCVIRFTLARTIKPEAVREVLGEFPFLGVYNKDCHNPEEQEWGIMMVNHYTAVKFKAVLRARDPGISGKDTGMTH